MPRRLPTDRFFGETLEERTIAGLSFTRSAFRQPVQLPMHTHRTPYFCLVLDGGFSETVGRTSYHAGRGALIFHPAGETHSNHIGPSGTSLLSVVLGTSWERRLADLEPAARPLPGLQGPRAACLALQLSRTLGRPDTVAPFEMEGLVLLLLAEAFRFPETGQLPRCLPRALEFIHAHFREDLDHAALARCAGVHPAHLARVFRRHIGTAVSAYVRRLRVEWAREALARNDLTLAVLAQEAGFADQAHFTRVFQKETGMTPGRYRRQISLPETLAPAAFKAGSRRSRS